LRYLILCFLDGFKDVLAEPFALNCAVVALDIGVLLGLAWLDVFEPNTLFFSLFHELATDISGAIIDTNGLPLSAPLDDLAQAAWSGCPRTANACRP
jgi:hypothetical protein